MPTRSPTTLRPVTITPFRTGAPGSVLIAQGDTRVLCTASVSTDLPPHLKPKPGQAPTQGWVTAEYAMLPGSTPERKKRGPDGRGTEIQRLIGRTLRAAVDLEKMPGLAVTCDCDVLQADGGTRTAAITGSYVALAQALHHARAAGLLQSQPIKSPIAAVSVGIIGGKAYLDLDYQLDVQAEVDMNVAMNARGQFIEVQASGEEATFTRAQLDTLLRYASRGIRQLLAVQRAALRSLRVTA